MRPAAGTLVAAWGSCSAGARELLLGYVALVGRERAQRLAATVVVARPVCFPPAISGMGYPGQSNSE